MSNLIKSTHYINLNDKKLIEMLSKPIPENSVVAQSHEEKSMDDTDAYVQQLKEQAEQEKKKLLLEAEKKAQTLLETAQQESAQLKAAAQQEINEWWAERREQDKQLAEQAKQEGYELGIHEGEQKASQLMEEKYGQLLEEAQLFLEEAYRKKEEIIQSSEPFLLSMSVEIAKKIIHRQLSLEPEWMVSNIQKVLTKRREHGLITLCVSPKYFNFIEDFKAELTLILDSQAELQIIPDQRIVDEGCIVRSSFGSIDARVDTQLTEIKKALLQLSAESEDGHESEHAASDR